MPRIVTFLVTEAKKALPAIAFFAIGFNVIVLTTQLLLLDYGAQFATFMVATTSALLVGKAVLVADAMPLMRRFDSAPLIRPILFKTVVYCAVVFVARVLEQVAAYVFGGGALAGVPEYVASHFSWHRFVAVQIWIFVLFLMYSTASELNALFGQGELARIFFTRRSSELKLTRRQRIRALTRISRLTERHGVAELRDPGAVAHAELVNLIEALATDASARVAGKP